MLNKGKGLRLEYFWGFWPVLICYIMYICTHTQIHMYFMYIYIIYIFVCPLRDTGEAMQSAACAQSSPRQGVRGQTPLC